MYRFIQLAHKSKTFPHGATMALCIDTENWKIGFAHYKNVVSISIDTEIQFLCFTLRWRKFIEDMQKGKQ